MKKELDKKMCETYPNIFCDRNKSPQETAMCWGLDCDDGWYDIIDDLCHLLSFIEEQTGISVVAVQVKEKFGTLRFYYDLKHDTEIEKKESVSWFAIIQKLVSYAENRSASVCEKCGSVWKITLGSTHNSGWIRTLCSKCREELDQEGLELEQPTKEGENDA